MRSFLIPFLVFFVLSAASPALASQGDNATGRDLFEEARYLEKVVGDFGKAAELYGKAASSDRDLAPEAYYFQARCELQRGDSRAALKALGAVLALKNCPEEIRKKAESAKKKIEETAARLHARVRASDLQKIHNELANSIEKIKKDAAALKTRGKKFPASFDNTSGILREAAAAAAAEKINAIIEVTSDRSGLQRYLANREFSMGYPHFTRFEYADAIRYFRAALIYDPDHEDAGDFLRLALYITGQAEGTGTEFNDSARKPGLPDNRKKKLMSLAADGNEYLAANEHEAALKVYEEALDLYRWEGDLFVESPDVVKSVEDIRNNIRTVYKWLNPREATRLAALNDERGLLISNLKLCALELAEASLQAAARKDAGEKQDIPQEAGTEEVRSSSISKPSTGGKGQAETEKKNIRITLRLLSYRPGFFERNGVVFKPSAATGPQADPPVYVADMTLKDFEALAEKGKGGGDSSLTAPVAGVVSAGETLALKSGKNIPYMARARSEDPDEDDGRPLPVVRSVFEGVLVEASYEESESSEKSAIAVDVTVSEFTGMFGKVPTEKGVVSLPGISLERARFFCEPGWGRILCVAPFRNPDSTGPGASLSGGGRTFLAVCITAEMNR